MEWSDGKITRSAKRLGTFKGVPHKLPQPAGLTTIKISLPEITPAHMRRRKNHPASSATGDTRLFFIQFSALNTNFDNIIPLPPQTRIVAASFSQQDFRTIAAKQIFLPA
jgi:hypothetical protein